MQSVTNIKLKQIKTRKKQAMRELSTAQNELSNLEQNIEGQNQMIQLLQLEVRRHKKRRFSSQR